MIRALIIAITITGCLAQQLGPDIDSKFESIQDKQDVGSLNSLLKEQLNRQSTRSNQPTTTLSTVITTTDIPSLSSSSIVPSNVEITTTTTSQRSQQFQYVKAKALSSLKCYHNNQTYNLGQKWNDDCLSVCECVAGDDSGLIAVSACQNRCPSYKDPPGDGCTLQRSKTDECCLEYVCNTEGKFPNPTTMTVMNTERGQLNISTTEIKLPSSSLSSSIPLVVSSQQQPAATTTTTNLAMAPTTTTTTTMQPPTTTIRSSLISAQQQAQAQQQQQRLKQTQKNIPTTTQQQQVPTTTTPIATTTLNSQTTSQQQQQQQTNRRLPATTTTTSSVPASNRLPKQVMPSDRLPQILATQSPNSLPPQRSRSLITTTTNQPQGREFGQRMSNVASSVSSQQEAESRQSISISSMAPITSTTTSTTTTADPQEVDPSDYDLCIEDSDSNAYKVNESWLEESCNQTCRCVFRSEPRNPLYDVTIIPTINMNNQSDNVEQTEIRCGVPKHCANVALKLKPTNECRYPTFMSPQKIDRCACPSVTCSSLPPTDQQVTNTIRPSNDVRSPSKSSSTTTATTFTAATNGITTPAATTTTTTVLEGCRKGNRLLSFGETFNDECHSTCTCDVSGEVKCQPLICPSEPPKSIQCNDWIIDTTFNQNSSENLCCPEFICQDINNNKEQPPLLIENNQHLMNTQKSFKSCILMGREVLHGQTVPEEIHARSQDCDRICTCNDGLIHCGSVCPPISEIPPEDLNCPQDQAYKAIIDCCTHWLCQTEIYELKDFIVRPINSTSVDVSFVMPLSSIDREGKIELKYYGVPKNSERAFNDQPPIDANWIRKTNIKTTGGVFRNNKVKYNMNNLKPNHKYWFKLIVEFNKPVEQPFDVPLESQIQSVIMPAPEFVLSQSSNTQPDMSSESSTNTPKQIITPTISIQPSSPTTTIKLTSSSTSTTTTTTTPPPTTTTTASTTTSTTTSTVSPTARLQPNRSSTNSPIAHKASSTTTSTTTTTTEPPPSTNKVDISPTLTIGQPNDPVDIIKPDVSDKSSNSNNNLSPCGKSDQTTNDLDTGASSSPWKVNIPSIDGPVQKYAWHLLVALSVMTVLFTIVSYMYLKKSSRVIAPITSQSAYDNPSFTKLVSYYANQPAHVLLVDESNQNYNNLAKQKNIEVDQSSPLHHHNNQIGDIHHHNGRQRLI